MSCKYVKLMGYILCIYLQLTILNHIYKYIAMAVVHPQRVALILNAQGHTDIICTH